MIAFSALTLLVGCQDEHPDCKQEGQHPLTGQRAPPISVGAGLIGDLGL